MSLFFEINYKNIEEQIEIICNRIDEIEKKMETSEEKQDENS